MRLIIYRTIILSIPLFLSVNIACSQSNNSNNFYVKAIAGHSTFNAFLGDEQFKLNYKLGVGRKHNFKAQNENFLFINYGLEYFAVRAKIKNDFISPFGTTTTDYNIDYIQLSSGIGYSLNIFSAELGVGLFKKLSEYTIFSSSESGTILSEKDSFTIFGQENSINNIGHSFHVTLGLKINHSLSASFLADLQFINYNNLRPSKLFTLGLGLKYSFKL